MARKKKELKCDDKGKFNTFAEAKEEAVSYTRRVVLLLSPMLPYYCHNHQAFHIGHWRSKEDIQVYAAMMKSLYRRDTLQNNSNAAYGWGPEKAVAA